MVIARLMIHVQQVEEDKLKDREEFLNKRAKTTARLMIHVHQVEEGKLKDREEFRNKRAKTTSNESGQQKDRNSIWSSFQQMPSSPAPSSASAPAPKHRCDFRN
ncbi:hypothetical protein MTR67_025831 [Solanum verrucosum]|uniref:Uncharacterized protein n=1 Tax=Solanum verrucosum TaxID=315347 RepID=A0AAF0QZF5_SOLVR|nr:hypothetical protein MTR67_025831 [Solanum verrucosum]